jgi:pyridoxal phosphate enzyme (YggS family)
MSIASEILRIQSELQAYPTKLIVVTKTRSIAELLETYATGVLDFGENRVQEMVEKQAQLPAEIRWHQIGHLQTNKVKYIAPFVHLIHSVDSLKLLKEINVQAKKNNRIIDCLLQMHIAQEETKFGLDETELIALLADPTLSELTNVRIIGLMGMASFTTDQDQVGQEFSALNQIFKRLQTNKTGEETGLVSWKELSMGMSGDYLLAARHHSTFVRVGSAIFGERK